MKEQADEYTAQIKGLLGSALTELLDINAVDQRLALVALGTSVYPYDIDLVVMLPNIRGKRLKPVLNYHHVLRPPF